MMGRLKVHLEAGSPLIQGTPAAARIPKISRRTDKTDVNEDRERAGFSRRGSLAEFHDGQAHDGLWSCRLGRRHAGVERNLCARDDSGFGSEIRRWSKPL